jgi:hypothetical protein
MSKTNPFNLPPPWNPGYALPQNVDDEGLERHAYTTSWAPRGSFDNPKVGTAGYAVPGYIKDEGYGAGAMTTRWAPRGKYYGPKVTHWLDKPSARVVGRTPMPGGETLLKIQTMAGVEQSVGGAGYAPITAYGLDAARAMIDAVKMMPPDERKRQLKFALDRIDPNLWSKAERGADAEAKLGVPAEIALERGLGSAMSYGLTAELVGLAKGKRPPERSQLGACLPCAAAAGMLGALPFATMFKSTATAKAAPAPAPSSQVFSHIGPFLIPVNQATWRDTKPLTAEKKAYVDQNIAIAAKAGGISIKEMKTGRYPFVKFKSGPTGKEYWGLYYQESAKETVVSYRKMTPSQVKALGDDDLGFEGLGYEGLGWSIGGAISSVGSGIKSAAGAVASGAGAVGGAVKDVAKAVGGAIWGVTKKVWKGIKWVTMKVVHFVVDAAKWVAKMTCKITSTPGVVQGAQAIATAAPNPYTVGIAAGITVTKMICDKVYGAPGSAEEKAAAAAAAQAQAEAEALAAAQAAAAATAAAEAAARRKKMMPVLLIGGVGIAAAAVLLLGKKK